MLPWFLNDDQIDPPERWNYLERCRQEKRWRELRRELLRPVHYRLFRLKQTVLGKNGHGDFIRFQIGLDRAPKLDATVPDVFVRNVVLPLRVDGTERLFQEVDRQLRGVYRLAGGDCHQLDLQKLDQLEDYEDHHAYHRLYWASRYAQAATLGHVGAEEGLVKDLGGWLENDWSADRRIAYSYTTSERIASLAETLFWIKNGRLSRAVSLVVPIKQVIWRDAFHLADNIEYRLGPHNHILNNARALYLASAVLSECGEALTWRNLAFKTWDEYFPQLVLPDGSFSEATSFYLLMNCRTALEYLIASRDHGRTLPPDLEYRLHCFLELGNELLRPDGSLPRFGNISPDHVVDDLWGFLTAAQRMGFLKSKPRHAAITPLTFYYDGSASRQTESQKPAREVLYADGGWGFLRRSDLGVELVVHGDPRKRTYTHGDAGRGSFELWWRGTVLIREPGNVSYGTPKRHWYRSGAGQNVTCLNGIGPGISQEYQSKLPAWYSEAQGGAWQRLPTGGFSFRTCAFQRLGTKVELERQWCWDSNGRLVMEEELQGSGQFSFASHLHLGETPWVQQSAELLTHIHSERAGEVKMRLQLPPAVALQLVPSPFAPEYGVERVGRSINLTGRVRLPVRWSVSWEFTA